LGAFLLASLLHFYSGQRCKIFPALTANQSTARAIEKDNERLANSHWLKAMQRDVELFGDRAFQEGWPKKNADKEDITAYN